MEFAPLHKRLVTWPMILMAFVMLVGAVAAFYRMRDGLGATTNLSDNWPWGLWKAFNVLCLIAVGAGGFTSAALIYIFRGERFHGVARSAVILGLLCYGFAGGSLVIDIGIPWRIVNPIFMWPEHSILFEVAWCVMLYLTVLALELAPVVFERFGWRRLEALWRRLVPMYAVVALTFFAYIMSHSYLWAGTAFVFFSLLNLLLRRVRDKPATPILLIMFGVILSTLHQSSLGSLFLLVPDKLSHFWWSPRLPFNFFISAVASGLCVLILERTISTRIWDIRRHEARLTELAKIAVTVLWGYLAFRVIDVFIEFVTVSASGDVASAFGGASMGVMFLVEIVVGVFVPALILTWERGRQHPWLRFTAASMVVVGVLFNRLAVCFIGYDRPGSYVPSFIEFAISAATVAAIVFLYTIGVKMLPIYETALTDSPEDDAALAAATLTR